MPKIDKLPIYDCFSHKYKQPFGAVRRRHECIFRLRFPHGTVIKSPALVMFRPGSKEKYTILEQNSERDTRFALEEELNRVPENHLKLKIEAAQANQESEDKDVMPGMFARFGAAEETADDDDIVNGSISGGSDDSDGNAETRPEIPERDSAGGETPAASTEKTRHGFLSRISSHQFSFRPFLIKHDTHGGNAGDNEDKSRTVMSESIFDTEFVNIAQMAAEAISDEAKNEQAANSGGNTAPAPNTEGAVVSAVSAAFDTAGKNAGGAEQYRMWEVSPKTYNPRYCVNEYVIDKSAYDLYTCYYTPQDLGTHYYYFTAEINGQRKYIKRVGANIGEIGEHGDLFQLTVYDAELETPDWLKGGVMYQIFPDRFAKNEEYEPQQILDRTLHKDWHDIPGFKPDESGMVWNNDYFGGNLAGIQDKIPYLKSIGVTCIYVCPIFEAHENHRYNTACYERIDPFLGKEQDFKLLCDVAGQNGIRIILDGVFSHTGADSVYFNRYGRYGHRVGAFRDPNSKYREWYCFLKYPEVYESWWGFSSLPNVQENTPSYTKYITGVDTDGNGMPVLSENGEPTVGGGIIQKWLNLGAAGWRLDVADELPDEFIDNINRGVKSCGSDKVIYGEVWEDATRKESYGLRRRYLQGGQLDSVMNYPFKECILNYVAGGDSQCFVDGVMTILDHYPKPCSDILMNFLSTHDTERAITRLAGAPLGEHDRQWQSEHFLSPMEYVYGVALLKCAMVLQFFLPGIPCVYYGDEAGQEGYKDPFNRRTYPWGRENTDLIEWTRELSRIRGSSGAFKAGGIHMPFADKTGTVLTRVDYEIGEAVTVFLNMSRFSRKLKLHRLPGVMIDYEVLRSKHDAEFTPKHMGVTVGPYDYAAVKFNIEKRKT